MQLILMWKIIEMLTVSGVYMPRLVWSYLQSVCFLKPTFSAILQFGAAHCEAMMRYVLARDQANGKQLACCKLVMLNQLILAAVSLLKQCLGRMFWFLSKSQQSLSDHHGRICWVFWRGATELMVQSDFLELAGDFHGLLLGDVVFNQLVEKMMTSTACCQNMLLDLLMQVVFPAAAWWLCC
ncbi:hypothetical protein Nepgr_002804 [Nepenthes gracilis]|uniref:Uncharacterized protein n=1 Tax=Nepenthes gracilis TaxID=150966 RepID=A0AAD3RYK8_NEPGR|nr:hypothetical protein Nepgr_002804 [Nepenthes gracilis]